MSDKVRLGGTLVKEYGPDETEEGVAAIVITVTAATPDDKFSHLRPEFRRLLLTARDKMQEKYPNKVMALFKGWMGYGPTCIIADGQNTFFSQKNVLENGLARDFLDPIYLQTEVEKYLDIRFKAWVSAQAKNDQESFFSSLTYNGWSVDTAKVLSYREVLSAGGWDIDDVHPRKGDDTVRGNLDHKVSQRILEGLSRECETFILFTGDGDFLPNVRSLKALGKRVILISGGSSTNKDLKEEASLFIDIASLMNKAPKSRDSILNEAWWRIYHHPPSIMNLSPEEMEFMETHYREYLKSNPEHRKLVKKSPSWEKFRDRSEAISLTSIGN